MSLGQPNSHQEPSAEADFSQDEQRAVETFTIDVSAGHRAGAASRRKHFARKTRGTEKPASQAPTEPNDPATVRRELIKPEVSRRHSKKRAAPLRRNDDAKSKASSKASSIEEPVTRGKTPSWLVSLAVHAVILLLLSFFSLASLQQEDFGLWASTAADDFDDEFVEFEVEPSVDFDSLDTEIPTELEDPGMASFGELSAESELSDVSNSMSLASDSLGELGSLFGDSGNGLSDLGEGSGSALTSFFGTQANARRVVFVIDNTGSMNYGGLETVIEELLKPDTVATLLALS
jgi:hypothetical protein